MTNRRNQPANQKPAILRLQSRVVLFVFVLTVGLAVPNRAWTWFNPTAEAAPMIFTVSTTADSGPGSFRQAILDANSNSGPDTIEFQIGTGPKTITFTAPLPQISSPVTIDGTTQPGFSFAPIIELNGNSLASDGLFITAGGSTVRGMVINNFHGSGIVLSINGENTIVGNYIGVDISGNSAAGNLDDGIMIAAGSAGNSIGGGTGLTRNVVSGNGLAGIVIFPGSAGNGIVGNYIGTNASGTAALGNSNCGIRIVDAPDNVIGGTTGNLRNIISGNGGDGVQIQDASATGNKLQGNFIGVDVSGNVKLGNSGDGVRVINASTVMVGGVATGSRNIISGNSRGLTIQGNSTGSVIQGNYVGTDTTGTIALGNSQEGIWLIDSDSNLIGGTATRARNLISGNALDGVRIQGGGARANLVQGNFIGTKVDGIGLLPNNGAGVDIYSAFDNSIGGTGPGTANIIAGNGYAGVLIQSGTGNAILGNSILKNARLGINLDPTDIVGLIANDQSDPDLGSNKRQNYPLLTSAIVAGGNTTILGQLNSTPNQQFRIEFFANSACHGSGFGEGESFIGFTNVTTDPNGDAAITATLPVTPAGQFITATATSPTNDTSEFSPCALVGGPNPGVLQFASSVFFAEEQFPTTKITVTRSSGMLGTVTVNYATSDGTATAPADYATTNGTLTFGDGEVIKTFTIPIVNDGLPEPQEKLNLTLSAPTGGATLAAQSTATLHINNYDPTYPSTSFSDASVVEGNSGTVDMVFTVTVSEHTNPVIVGYQTDDGLAQSGLDYQSVSGTVTFNPGENSKDVLVPVIGDLLVEGDEMFFLRINALSAGYVIKGQGEGTIIDDDSNAPTAAPAKITGQITTTDGNPLGGVTLNLTGGSTSKAITDEQGRYQFTNVETDNFYLLTAERANYTFAPAVQAFSLLAERANSNFTATALAFATANPLDTPEFFVRQQYLDFLAREPDQGGLHYWSARILGCRDDAACIAQRHTDVSAAFYLEQEFQTTGYFVYRIQKASFGTRPLYSDFISDRSHIAIGSDSDGSKQIFADQWVARAEFKQVYPDEMGTREFVDRLFDTAGLAGSAVEREQAKEALATHRQSRAQVLRDVIEMESFKSVEHNKAFVLMQYFGYLRRDPDQAGYDFWLNVLNAHLPNDASGRQAMVCAFVTSSEYQERFSAVHTHSNAECGP